MKKIFVKLSLVAILIVYNYIDSSSKLTLNTQENISLTAATDTYPLFLPIIAKQGSDYFVSPLGNDANSGTLQYPWRTIQKAARTLISGDTVYIRGGIYNEAVSFRNSGTELMPIRILAYSGENPIIDGTNVSEPGGYLLRLNGDYIYLSGLEVRNSVYMGIYVYGNYDLVDNVFSHHNQTAGILIMHGNHSTVENSRVWRNVLRNEFEKSNNWDTGLSAMTDGVSYATIRNNIVWENWGEGLTSWQADHITIEDNVTHDNLKANLYISDSTNVLCQRNFVYTDPGSYMFPYGNHHVGIMMGDEHYTPPSANIMIINNIAYGNDGNFGWWQGPLGGGMNNVLIANNSFVNVTYESSFVRGGVIISSGAHQNVRFQNNIVQQFLGLPIIDTVDQPGVTYSHNLWSRTPRSAAVGPGDVITSDPGLVKLGLPFSADWFRLANYSPAIDKGLYLPDILSDYFRNVRDSNPDIGAVEYLP